MHSRRGVVVTAIAGAISWAFFAWIASIRIMDFDEGYYGLAARLVYEGPVLYRDLFYPQTPLLPYAYGAWMKVFGTSLYAARSLSALCSALLVILVCRHALIRFGSPWVAAIAVAALVADRSAIEWYTTVKTYALSTLCLFAAYHLVDRVTSERTPSRWLLAGMLLGLAVEVRLLFVATVPVFAVLAWRTPTPHRRHSIVPLATGLTLAGLPALILLAMAPSQFVFDNFGWAQFRSEHGLIGGLPQKAHVAWQVVSGMPQYAGLVVLATAATVWNVSRRRSPPIAFWLALSLGAVSLLPTPTYPQYFCTTLPFLLFVALELLPSQLLRRRVVLLGMTIATFVSVSIGVGAAVALHRLDGTSGPFDQLTVSAMEDLADVVDAHTEPGEVVLSFRPMYVFLSHARPVAGFENDIAPVLAQIGAFSVEEVERLRLIRNEEIEALIARRGVRVIVSPIDTRGFYGRAGRPWDRFVRDAGYELMGTYRAVDVWVRPG